MTGENPRKGYTHTKQVVPQELADTLITTIIAMQEFTQNSSETRRLIRSKIVQVEGRLRAYPHKMD
jgi:hypothetical protein